MAVSTAEHVRRWWLSRRASDALFPGRADWAEATAGGCSPRSRSARGRSTSPCGRDQRCILVAAAAALHQILQDRGETVDPMVITVPVSGRRVGSGSAVGNLVSPMLVGVPTSGGLAERLAEVEAAVRAHKAAATGPPPIAVLGGAFRLLARLGVYRFYLNYQRRFHTLITHVRGPSDPVTLDGHQISAAIPVAVAEAGNTTVYFQVLSTPVY